MSENTRFVLCVIACVIAAFYAGAMFGFFPFTPLGPSAGAAGYAALIVSAVIAVSACWLKEKDEPEDGGEERKEEKKDGDK